MKMAFLTVALLLLSASAHAEDTCPDGTHRVSFCKADTVTKAEAKPARKVRRVVDTNDNSSERPMLVNDADGDGVVDNNDCCKRVKGPSWNHGCPVGKKLVPTQQQCMDQLAAPPPSSFQPPPVTRHEFNELADKVTVLKNNPSLPTPPEVTKGDLKDVELRMNELEKVVFAPSPDQINLALFSTGAYVDTTVRGFDGGVGALLSLPFGASKWSAKASGWVGLSRTHHVWWGAAFGFERRWRALSIGPTLLANIDNTPRGALSAIAGGGFRVELRWRAVFLSVSPFVSAFVTADDVGWRAGGNAAFGVYLF